MAIWACAVAARAADQQRERAVLEQGISVVMGLSSGFLLRSIVAVPFQPQCENG